MKLIGKGAFTKCYLNDDSKTVTLHSVDNIKECMAYGWFPSSYLFPNVNPTEEQGVYTMKYYKRVSSLKNSLSPRQWDLYKVLREVMAKFDYMTHVNALFTAWHEAFDTIPSKYAREREVIKEALDACANYGQDINFEISPRNIAVQGNKLVLLDCFFLTRQLKAVRS